MEIIKSVPDSAQTHWLEFSFRLFLDLEVNSDLKVLPVLVYLRSQFILQFDALPHGT